MKKNNFIISCLACCMMLFCMQGVFAQGTIGEYPGAGVGFDSGCGYPDAGNSDPGVSDASLAGNSCGSAFDVTFGAWTETAAGFDITGFELNNYDIDQEAAYGIRLFYGPQDNCCTICLDAMIDLTQPNTACGTFGPQVDLSSFGYPIPASYGLDIFGVEVIPYTDMCPNTEYFAQYQFISATAVDLTDPDGNFCAMDDALITNAGTLTTVQTLVAPGTRDPLVINSATFTPVAAADCASTDVMFDFTIDVTSGCTVSFGTCSKGLEIELRASLACGDGTTLDINTGPLVNDPTNCFIGIAGTNEISAPISLGTAADLCAIFACDPTASIEVYARHTFCEADAIVGDGSGNDEALTTISLAAILADFDAAACCMVVPAVCSSTYNYTAPAEVCNGEAIDFTIDAGCDISTNIIDFGAGTGVGPSLDLDLFIYVPGGVPSVAPAGTTVIPADIDGGATGNADIAYLGTATDGGAGPGGGCGDLSFAAGQLLNATCDPITVTFFVVPYSYDFDTDGDGTYGAYLADGNTEACPVLQYDVVINPILEVIEDVTVGCDPIAGVFAGDGMGGVFDTDGDGAITFADACMTAQLDPTADCTDGAMLPYDFSALDVGTCSGDLTGTLTCDCPPATCASTYDFTAPAEVCNGAAIDFVVDAACDISLNTIDFGGGVGVDPSLDLDFYIYVPGGVASQAPAGTVVIPADIDGGATGNADIAYLGTAGAATTVGNGCGDFSFPAGTLLNATCDPITVTFFAVPYSYDYDIDGDGTYGAYLADGNALACPVLQYDVVINPIFEVIEDVTVGCDPIAGVFAGDGAGGVFDTDGDGVITFADACDTEQLAPTADCTDGATVDYDFSALDVGTCSGDLTGTLTCDCPPGVCESFNAITVAAGCAVFDICIGYADADQDGLSDVGGADPTGTMMTVDFGGSTGGTFVNDGVFGFDTDGDGAPDATGYCVTYEYFAQGCMPELYSGLVTLTCPDGSSGTLDLSAAGGPVVTLTSADVVGDVFGVAGGGAFYPVLEQGNAVAAVCPTVTGMTGTAASIDIVSPDGTVCETITGEAPACDATGGNAAEPVQLNALADPLLSALFGAGTFTCTIDETADLSYTCGMCTDPSVPGCTDPCAPNFDPLADMDDGSCEDYDDTCNADCTAGPFGGTWDPVACACTGETAPVDGCTDPTAGNYDPAANCDDGSCMAAPMCSISATVTSMCDDGDTEDPADDVTTYTVTVAGTDTGAGFTASVAPDAGALTYGTALTYTVTGTGGLSVTFTDDTDTTCTAVVSQSSGCATIANIPTVGEWGLIILGLLMSITAIVGIRARREEEATA